MPLCQFLLSQFKADLWTENTESVHRELYLDGNDLGCEGAVELIKLLADFAEEETFQKLEEQRRKEEKALEAAERGC